MRLENLNTIANYSVDVRESERLKHLSPQEKFRELLQNISGYENEVLKDEAVSVLYSYWFDEHGEPYTSPKKREIHRFRSQFDPQERGHYPLAGFDKMTQIVRHNPGKVALWYSPKGPAAFDNYSNNPYRDVNFIYGQLYLQYFDPEQGKANGVAIKVTHEDIFQTLMPDVYNEAEEQSDPIERIKTYLLNPINTNLTIHEFLNKDWDIQTTYIDKARQNHDFGQILTQIRNKLFHGSDSISPEARRFAIRLANSPLREDDVLRGYLQFVRDYQRATGQQVTNLMGACGGKIVTAGEIDDLLGATKAFSNIFSSDFRLSTQARHDNYACPECGRMHQGEIKGSDPKTWKQKCSCGYSFNCAPTSAAA